MIENPTINLHPHLLYHLHQVMDTLRIRLQAPYLEGTTKVNQIIMSGSLIRESTIFFEREAPRAQPLQTVIGRADLNAGQSTSSEKHQSSSKEAYAKRETAR